MEASRSLRNPGQQEVVLDAHPEVSLDFRHVEDVLCKGYTGPFLILDSNIVRTKARRLAAAMPRVRSHYAVKANPDPRILRVLIEEGVGFEVASTAELDLLISLGVPAGGVFYSNPIKPRAFVEHAASRGLRWFSFDCVEELRKIVSVQPDARLYLRINTPNIGSDWPLSGKFGAYQGEIRDVLAAAADLKADLCGVTFHAGSQCRNAQNWRVGIERSKSVFEEMGKFGLTPRMLNIGGGFPVRLSKPIPSIETIGEVVSDALADLPPDIEVVAEPGRYLVSDAAYFVCRVIGTTIRNGKRWMYWDAGMFGGLVEGSEGLRYDIRTDRTGPKVPWCVAGPTCDSVDVLWEEEMLPEDLREGDFIYIPNAGAYTTAYASTFNGFPLPDVIVL
jgi:ornithine decarboxylase